MTAVRIKFLNQVGGPLFIVALFSIYIVRRLIHEVSGIEEMMSQAPKVPAAIKAQYLNGYNYIFDNNMPLIVEACCFLGAWYVFHHYVYPRLGDSLNNYKLWIYGLSACMLLVLGPLIYYSFHREIGIGRYRDESYHSREVMVSVYIYRALRVQKVFADTVGLAIILVVCELIVHYIQNLIRKIADDNSVFFAGSQLFIILSFFAISAFNINILDPQPLWLSDMDIIENSGRPALRNFLLAAGYCTLVFFVQKYFYRLVSLGTDYFQTKRNIIEVLFRLLLAWAIVCTIHWTFLIEGYRHIIPHIQTGTERFLLFAQKHSLPYIFAPISLFKLFREASVIFLVCYSVAVVIAFVRQWYSRFLGSRFVMIEAESPALRTGIYPHFIYETLDDLHVTALQEKNENTAEGIGQLSELMQIMMEKGNQESISLSQEIEYLHNYIRLRRRGLDPAADIRIAVNLQKPDREITIAPMLLQPLVENAFKHGINYSTPSWISIDLSVKGNSLYFEVRNSLPDTDRYDNSREKSGIGQQNVEKRLALIYPDLHKFHIWQAQNEFVVQLTLILSD